MQPLRMPIHVLVVDDDRDIRDSLLEVLEEAGYSSTGAEDGRRALAILQGDARRPDVILLDLQMPNLDGPGFRAEQLKLPELAKIPVVIVTADANAAKQASSLGVSRVLQKPLRLPQLLELIPQVVQSANTDERAE